MLYWPTEKGFPCVVEDRSPPPTQHSPEYEPSSEEWLARALQDADQCFADNVARLQMRHYRQIHDLRQQHDIAMLEARQDAQEAQDEQASIQ